jgi:hypothetical protein
MNRAMTTEGGAGTSGTNEEENGTGSDGEAARHGTPRDGEWNCCSPVWWHIDTNEFMIRM